MTSEQIMTFVLVTVPTVLLALVTLVDALKDQRVIMALIKILPVKRVKKEDDYTPRHES